MSEEAGAARRFAHAILRPQDQMSVLQFATEVRELTPFTNNLSRDRPRAEPVAWRLGDGALRRHWRRLASGWARSRGARCWCVVSDGDDTAKNSTYAEALEQALRNEVMIYSLIDVPIEASAGRDPGGEHALITLAEQTGGKYFYVADGGLDKAFAQGERRPAHAILARLLPENQEPGSNFHRIVVTIPRAANEVQRAQQGRLLRRFADQRSIGNSHLERTVARFHFALASKMAI